MISHKIAPDTLSQSLHHGNVNFEPMKTDANIFASSKDLHNSVTNWLNIKSYYNWTISLLSQRMKEAEIQGLLWWDLMQQIQSIRWSIEENQIRPVKDLLPSMFYCCWTKVLFKVSLYGWRLRTLDGGNSQTKMRHNCCMNTIHSNMTETNFNYKL